MTVERTQWQEDLEKNVDLNLVVAGVYVHRAWRWLSTHGESRIAAVIEKLCMPGLQKSRSICQLLKQKNCVVEDGGSGLKLRVSDPGILPGTPSEEAPTAPVSDKGTGDEAGPDTSPQENGGQS